jgi:uncharacterized membrane protein
MKARYFTACIVLAVLAIGATLLAWPHLPARVPLHWNIHGQVDAYGPRSALLAIGPGAMLAELLVFAALPALSPRRFALESFARTYLRIMAAAVAFGGYLTAVLLYAALTGHLDVSGAVLGGVSVLFVILGNVMGKVRRNFFIGIRTPWTLASERVWYATHRLAAKSMVAAGILSIGAAVAGGLAGLAAWIAIVLAGVMVPVIYSFVHYKALERDGTLEAS